MFIRIIINKINSFVEYICMKIIKNLRIIAVFITVWRISYYIKAFST
jgi:hypothetical protein